MYRQYSPCPLLSALHHSFPSLGSASSFILFSMKTMVLVRIQCVMDDCLLAFLMYDSSRSKGPIFRPYWLKTGDLSCQGRFRSIWATPMFDSESEALKTCRPGLMDARVCPPFSPSPFPLYIFRSLKPARPRLRHPSARDKLMMATLGNIQTDVAPWCYKWDWVWWDR